MKKPVALKIINIVERIANVNKKGYSRVIYIDHSKLKSYGCKPREVVLFQSNNGATYLRKTAPLGKKYLIRKIYKRSRGNALIGFQLIGLNKKTQHSRGIPQRVRKEIMVKYDNKCIFCGSTNRLEVDHKNGRYNNKSDEVTDFQILCKSCNDKKRERCKKCLVTGHRFNVQTAISPYLYKKPYTCGSMKYNAKVGCKGCFLYDIEDFYKKNMS